LSKLKPVFSKTGSTHAGNASQVSLLCIHSQLLSIDSTCRVVSQVSDGAAAVLLTRRSKAKELGLPILAKFCCCAVAGVEPKVMGIGPAFAIPKVLSKAGISKDEVDLWEINEGTSLLFCIS